MQLMGFVIVIFFFIALVLVVRYLTRDKTKSRNQIKFSKKYGFILNQNNLFSSKKQTIKPIPIEDRNILDLPLLKFTAERKENWWTVRDAVRGTQIFGGIGSGKSSGSGRAIAKSFLKNGFGGVILCAKPDERAAWEKYAAETGRTNDLIIFDEDSEYEFNPLQYEMNRSGKGAGEVFNLVNLFMEIYKMGNRFTGNGNSGESERYWDNALKRCLTAIIQLLKLAEREVSIRNMRRMISSAPLEHELEKIGEMTGQDLDNWAERSFCVDCILIASEKTEGDQSKADEYEFIYDYFMREFPTLPEKTRPTIVESFLGLALPFSSGILKKHFSQDTNIYPEQAEDGKIIILDFPVKEYLQSGVYAQGIFKLLWQQAAERRQVEKNSIPIFLWVDEAQLFLSDYDQIFQTTARSARACTVFLSQNISNYYVSIGGKNPQAKADSLLGNLSTKIFHANNDTVTNEWASKTIGKAFKEMESLNVGDHQSVGIATQFHWQVEPREFTILRSGGKDNDFRVQGIITIAGRAFSNQTNFFQIQFNQQA